MQENKRIHPIFFLFALSLLAVNHVHAIDMSLSARAGMLQSRGGAAGELSIGKIALIVEYLGREKSSVAGPGFNAEGRHVYSYGAKYFLASVSNGPVIGFKFLNNPESSIYTIGRNDERQIVSWGAAAIGTVGYRLQLNRITSLPLADRLYAESELGFAWHKAIGRDGPARAQPAHGDIVLGLTIGFLIIP